MSSCEEIVVGNRNAEFAEAISRSACQHTIVDLVRIVEATPASAGAHYGICW